MALPEDMVMSAMTSFKVPNMCAKPDRTCHEGGGVCIEDENTHTGRNGSQHDTSFAKRGWARHSACARSRMMLRASGHGAACSVGPVSIASAHAHTPCLTVPRARQIPWTLGRHSPPAPGRTTSAGTGPRSDARQRSRTVGPPPRLHPHTTNRQVQRTRAQFHCVGEGCGCARA
jgi:hypothetical protein